MSSTKDPLIIAEGIHRYLRLLEAPFEKRTAYERYIKEWEDWERKHTKHVSFVKAICYYLANRAHLK